MDPYCSDCLFLDRRTFRHLSSNPLAKKTQKKVDTMMRILRETYTGVRVIRAFDKASFEKSGQTKPLKGTQK